VDERLRTERSRTFGKVAEVYDATRPGYPDEAVAWLTGRGSLRVVELGAGTGKLTASLVAAGHEVVATEPSGPMLAQLSARLSCTVVRSRAERLPFATGSVDIVVIGQAFHWFDPRPTVPEIARVLRRGGHLALVWNLRDESVPWVRRLSAIIGSEVGEYDLQLDALADSELFGAITHEEFRFWQLLDRDGLLGLVRSRSYVAALSEPERAEMLARVSDLYDEYGRGRDGLRLPYRTHCYRARAVKKPVAADEPEPFSGDNLLFDFR